jgi:hypothetical protein
MKDNSFWDVMPCILVEVYRSSWGTSVIFYLITRRRMPEDATFHNHRRENLKSQIGIFFIFVVAIVYRSQKHHRAKYWLLPNDLYLKVVSASLILLLDAYLDLCCT